MGRGVLAGREATTLRYNGGVPGPTLRLRPGDRLCVDLVNEPTNHEPGSPDTLLTRIWQP